MRREMNGVTKSRFEMFSNNDEAVINKKLPKELLLRFLKRDPAFMTCAVLLLEDDNCSIIA